jgi:hypothetical protein
MAGKAEALKRLIDARSISILMNTEPKMYIEYEEFDKQDLGSQHFADLGQLQKKTLEMHRAYRCSGDTIYIAKGHLERLGL